MEQLRRAAREVFPLACAGTEARPWAGLRPATPTGVPIIGRVDGAPANLLFNAGHGALGFTLAAGSARRVSRQLQGAAEQSRGAPVLTRSAARPAEHSA